MRVRVSEAGGVFEEVEINEGATVQTVLTEVGVNCNQTKQLRLNMKEATLQDIVNDGDTIYVVPSIKGNR